MKIKNYLAFFCLLINLNAFANEFKLISLYEEDAAFIYYNSDELYFVLPYVGEYTKLDRSMLSVDKDGFLKFKYKDNSLLIIDGDYISQCFTKFQNDGENKYSDAEYGFHNYNINNISASSYFSETINGKTISYTADNLYKCFFIGCKCHPYSWNNAHIPWVEGTEDNGIGESIVIEYKNQIYGISILNGYVDINNMKLYKENSRLKQIEIENLETGKKKIVNFEDKVYFNYITFEAPLTKLKITIKDIYEGTKYTDTCVSAVLDNPRELSKDNYYEIWFNNNKINNWHYEKPETVLNDFYSKEVNLFTNKYMTMPTDER